MTNTALVSSEQHAKTIEQSLSLCFKNPALLSQAFTHSSYARLSKKKPLLHDNERLEFFGDAVLKLLVSEHLYAAYPHLSEGELSIQRANIVADKTLADIAKQFDLGSHLLFSFGEQKSGGASKASNLAAALESLLGAMYLDQGLPATRTLFNRFFQTFLKDSAETCLADYKTMLQEILQKAQSQLPFYTVLKEEGPEHAKYFNVTVTIQLKQQTFSAEGRGQSKKEAEQAAAKLLLAKLPPAFLPK